MFFSVNERSQAKQGWDRTECTVLRVKAYVLPGTLQDTPLASRA